MGAAILVRLAKLAKLPKTGKSRYPESKCGSPVIVLLWGLVYRFMVVTWSNTNMETMELCAQGRAYYDRFLKAFLEPTYRGQYLILDVETGEYAISQDYAPSLVEQQKKHDGRLQYVTRIGERALMRRGGRRT